MIVNLNLNKQEVATLLNALYYYRESTAMTEHYDESKEVNELIDSLENPIYEDHSIG